MTTKRKTKAQREAEQKEALYRRVHDVYSGALGKCWDSETDGDFATAQILSDVVPALNEIFGPQRDNTAFLWSLPNLRYYDSPESATDFLFRAGIRA